MPRLIDARDPNGRLGGARSDPRPTPLVTVRFSSAKAGSEIRSPPPNRPYGPEKRGHLTIAAQQRTEYDGTCLVGIAYTK